MNQINIGAPMLFYYGNKFKSAPWITNFFSSHRAYVNPFGDSVGVLQHKSRSDAKAYNPIGEELINVLRMLRDSNVVEALRHTVDYAATQADKPAGDRQGGDL